jgi:hypothetical protein
MHCCIVCTATVHRDLIFDNIHIIFGKHHATIHCAIQTRFVGPSGATLGRATDNDASIADKELSRRHSRIEYDRYR